MASAGAAPPAAISAMANAAGASPFAVPPSGAATRHSATAQNFSSGCCDIGSMASLVTALMHRSSPYTSFQGMGAKPVSYTHL